MSERLPDWIAPIPLAEAKKALAGSVDLAGMPRLKPLLHGPQEAIEVRLQFGIDDAGIRYLRGTIYGGMVVTCQRCLQAVKVPVQVKLRLGIVEDIDARDRLPEQYDPLLTTRDPLRLTDLIEDELLLCLPNVPMHDKAEQCEPPRPLQEASTEPAKENPFAVLAQLKDKL